MKRPQFSLRLVLLVVALAAAIFGWRAAAERLNRIDRNGERYRLQLTIDALETLRVKWGRKSLEYSDQVTHNLAVQRLRELDKRIAETEGQLENVGK
jgi:hypothetical protein